jgi:hypothetical protein
MSARRIHTCLYRRSKSTISRCIHPSKRYRSSHSRTVQYFVVNHVQYVRLHREEDRWKADEHMTPELPRCVHWWWNASGLGVTGCHMLEMCAAAHCITVGLGDSRQQLGFHDDGLTVRPVQCCHRHTHTHTTRGRSYITSVSQPHPRDLQAEVESIANKNVRLDRPRRASTGGVRGNTSAPH